MVVITQINRRDMLASCCALISCASVIEGFQWRCSSGGAHPSNRQAWYQFADAASLPKRRLPVSNRISDQQRIRRFRDGHPPARRKQGCYRSWRDPRLLQSICSQVVNGDLSRFFLRGAGLCDPTECWLFDILVDDPWLTSMTMPLGADL
jgi:hypothetical protein